MLRRSHVASTRLGLRLSVYCVDKSTYVRPVRRFSSRASLKVRSFGWRFTCGPRGGCPMADNLTVATTICTADWARRP
jgi:hypothetical protein